MPSARVHLFVSGRVQGVFYRASTRDEAARLGLAGFVRNLPDGRVEVVAEGEAANVEALVRWCQDGPPGARVTGVERRDEPPTGETGPFTVNH